VAGEAAESPDLSDERLLAAAAAGDRAAFARLLTRHLPRVLGLASRLLGSREDAEDIAQETMLRLWRKAPSWRRDGPPVAAWVYAVALSLCRKAWRRRRHAASEVDDALADQGSSPAESAESRERARLLREGLARLPPRQREALVLFYDHGLSMSEIGEAMGIGEHAVESLLARGRRALRVRLSGAIG
jgi:RNA polymerase sigma-70 factor (ECF subfamily)